MHVHTRTQLSGGVPSLACGAPRGRLGLPRKNWVPECCWSWGARAWVRPVAVTPGGPCVSGVRTSRRWVGGMLRMLVLAWKRQSVLIRGDWTFSPQVFGNWTLGPWYGDGVQSLCGVPSLSAWHLQARSATRWPCPAPALACQGSSPHH